MKTPGGIAIVNQSSRITPGQAQAMVDAVAIQAVEFCAIWSRLPCPPTLFASLTDVPVGMARLILVDASDEPSALGYHTLDGAGVITGIVAAQPVLDEGGDILTGGAASVSAVLSHEVLETIADPFVNAWCDSPDGREWAKEVADPVQGTSYQIGDVSVSDYVFPAFFDMTPPADSRFDRSGVLTAPFTLGPGGYAVVRPPGGKATQIGLRPAYLKPHPRARGVRRIGAS